MEINTETKLTLIARKSRKEPKLRFISLMHLLNVSYLMSCFEELKRKKAAGVDGRTLESYTTEEIQKEIEEVVEKMKKKKYKPQPVRRVYIKKESGKQRPLGIPTVIDKVVQLGCKKILENMFEGTLLPNSYGYRKGKNAHECLKEVNHMIMGKKVSWIIDADIKGFFDNVDHGWMIKSIEQRVGDPNFKSLLIKFLKAGVMEEGEYKKSDIGTPQGGIISPILANIYLHYVLDLWVEKEIKKKYGGYIQSIRYADDFIIGVQHRNVAEKIMKDLKKRLAKFGLELSEEKTKIIEFGRFAENNRRRRGRGKPETFDFLGFTHYCGRTRDGRYSLKVKTSKKKMKQALVRMKLWLKKVRNAYKLKDIWKVLRAKLTGHYNYYGISGNSRSMKAFYWKTCKMIMKWMNRRSQKKSWNYEGFNKYLKMYPLPAPKLKYQIYNTW